MEQAVQPTISADSFVTAQSSQPQVPISPIAQEYLNLEQKFYESLEQADNLVDYFCVIGLDQKLVQQLAAQAFTDNGHSPSPQNRGLSSIEIMHELSQAKPGMISRFPPKNKKSFKLEEGVEASLPEYGFPNGYHIIEAVEQPKHHQIPVMFDGGLVKAFAQILIFYEDFDDYINAYKNFHNHEKSKGITLDRGSLTSKSYSDVPSTDLHATQPADIASQSSRALSTAEAGGGVPQDKERATVVFNTDEEEKAQFAHIPPNNSRPWVTQAARAVENMISSTFNSKGDVSHSMKAQGGGASQARVPKRIFVPKAICLMSRYPFYDYFSEIIEDIYLASKHHMLNILSKNGQADQQCNFDIHLQCISPFQCTHVPSSRRLNQN